MLAAGANPTAAASDLVRGHSTGEAHRLDRVPATRARRSPRVVLDPHELLVQVAEDLVGR